MIHVGFVDYPLLKARITGGDWLHAALAEVASSIVGIDTSSEGVRWARSEGYEAYVADGSSPAAIEALELEPADVVVAGEVIEHVDAPGPFLRGMLPLCAQHGRLITTTPNAYRVLNFLVLVTGRELIHPDHVAWHSPHTLATILRVSGWNVEYLMYYQNPPNPLSFNDGITPMVYKALANVARRLVTSSRWPYWCDGLVAVARPA